MTIRKDSLTSLGLVLAAGGADGLELGDNAKAALVARGLAERRAGIAGVQRQRIGGAAGARSFRRLLVRPGAAPVAAQPAAVQPSRASAIGSSSGLAAPPRPGEMSVTKTGVRFS